MTTPHVIETPLPLEPTTRDPFIEADEPIDSLPRTEPTPDVEDTFTGMC